MPPLPYGKYVPTPMQAHRIAVDFSLTTHHLYFINTFIIAHESHLVCNIHAVHPQAGVTKSVCLVLSATHKEL